MPTRNRNLTEPSIDAERKKSFSGTWNQISLVWVFCYEDYFFTFRLEDQNTIDKINVQEMEVRSPADTLHRDAKGPIGTRKKKKELFIKLTFQTPYYRFLLENSLLATADRTTNKLAWSELCLEKTRSALRRPTEMECAKWAQLLLSYEMRQWSKGGRAWTLQSEELAFTIKKLSCFHICIESSIATPKNTHTATHLKVGNRFNGWN